MDYEWMLQNGKSAKQVKKYLSEGNLQDALYYFIDVCKMGYTEQELRVFIDGLLEDVKER